METITYTPAEIKAYRIMTFGDALVTNQSNQLIKEKADELILLAEKIKAERARASM
jgi:hypothetical protein